MVKKSNRNRRNLLHDSPWIGCSHMDLFALKGADSQKTETGLKMKKKRPVCKACNKIIMTMPVYYRQGAYHGDCVIKRFFPRNSITPTKEKTK